MAGRTSLRRGRRLLAVAAAVTLAVGSLSAIEDSAQAEGPPSWNLLSNPIPASSGNSALADVSCVTSTWCMAVGHNYAQPLVEHWDGSNWTVIPGPSVPSGGDLVSVVCTSMTWCMAVGSAGPATLTTMWDGSEWSVVNSPSPGSTSSALVRLSCTSSTFCMAVGTQSAPTTMLVERWNGSAWSVAAPPPADANGSDALRGISCTSTTACMAVGVDATSSTTANPYSAVWNGSTWSQVAVPDLGTDDDLSGVSCAQPTACVGVGSSNGGIEPDFQIPLFEGWNGSQWTVQAGPTDTNRYDNYHLTAVDCLGSTSCVATGQTDDQPYVAQLSGTTWTDQSLLAYDGDQRLDGVSCVAAQTCAAVGQDTETTGFVHPAVASDYQYVGGEYEGFPTAVTVSSSMNPAASGDPVTFTAQLGTYSGDDELITFFADSFDAPIPGCASIPATVNDQAGSGTAACTVTSLPEGTHNIYAVNSGGGYQFASSAALTNGETITNGVVITTTSLPPAPLYKYYTTTLKATGGTKPLKWTLVSGSLPTGLKLSSGGVISGTPTQQDGGTFVIKVTDSGKPQAYEQLPFGIDVTPLTFTSLAVSDPVAKSFSIQLKATGGKGQLTWSVVAGSLPPGVKLSSSGVLSGTVSTPGNYSVGVGVHDTLKPYPQYSSGGVYITIDPIAISPTTLKDASVGKYYTTTFKAVGGKATLKWTVSSGTPPTGVKLSTSGTLSGTPKAAGDYSFTVTVTDASTPANVSNENVTLTVT